MTFNTTSGTLVFPVQPIPVPVFHNKTPRADQLSTAKLAAKNIHDIASVMKNAGATVDVTGDVLTVNTVVFNLGDWIVQEYNYVTGLEQYRPASLAERQKYDLR